MTQITHDDFSKYPENLPVKDVNVYVHPSCMAMTHDYSCPVCRENHAVIEGSTSLMQPCWTCQKKGYMLIKADRSWWKDLLFEWLTGKDR